MRLTRRIRLQLATFAAMSIAGAAVLLFGYVDLPARLFGAERYRVTVELPESAGLYKNGNVTYRGTEVGQIENVHLTPNGVAAVMTLDSSVPIPSDLTAEVHSVTALGEQYIALTPHNGTSAPLRNGDVIPRARTTVPPPIDRLLDSTNRGLEAIPRNNLKTMIDESYTAVGNLGPELSRIINGSTRLAIDAAANQGAVTALIDKSPQVLDSQAASADAISAWASHLASITQQLRANNGSVAGLIDSGGPAADEARQLVQRLQPTIPLLLANLISVGQVGTTFQPNIEQILVLAPQGVASAQAGFVPNLYVPGAHFAPQGLSLSLNTNLPPPCTTGFLPAQQRVAPSVEDVPERPAGNLYCRIPQDSPFDVRGARNIPCETKPWKRAPTVKMCESDEEYVPLNDGMNWKGDPNATLSGQDVPQRDPETAPPPAALPKPQAAQLAPPSAPPIATAQYDPATGTYRGPDGRLYTQTNMAQTAPHHTTWQQMLMPSEPTR